MLKNASVRCYIRAQGRVADDLVQNIRQLRDPSSGEVNDLMSTLYKWALECKFRMNFITIISSSEELFCYFIQCYKNMFSAISVVIFGRRIGFLDLSLHSNSIPQRVVESMASFFKGLWYTFTRWPLHKNGKTKTWKQFVKDLDFLYK